MIIPQIEEVIVNIVYCPICKEYYSTQVGRVTISCGVDHTSGTCCHYGDRKISKEQVEKIKSLLKDEKA